MPKPKMKPHHVDASMDLLNVTGLESESDMVIRKLPNQAVILRPLTWRDMGILIAESPGERS